MRIWGWPGGKPLPASGPARGLGCKVDKESAPKFIPYKKQTSGMAFHVEQPMEMVSQWKSASPLIMRGFVAWGCLAALWQGQLRGAWQVFENFSIGALAHMGTPFFECHVAVGNGAGASAPGVAGSVPVA